MHWQVRLCLSCESEIGELKSEVNHNKQYAHCNSTILRQTNMGLSWYSVTKQKIPGKARVKT